MKESVLVCILIFAISTSSCFEDDKDDVIYNEPRFIQYYLVDINTSENNSYTIGLPYPMNWSRGRYPNDWSDDVIMDLDPSIPLFNFSRGDGQLSMLGAPNTTFHVSASGGFRLLGAYNYTYAKREYDQYSDRPEARLFMCDRTNNRSYRLHIHLDSNFTVFINRFYYYAVFYNGMDTYGVFWELNNMTVSQGWNYVDVDYSYKCA